MTAPGTPLLELRDLEMTYSSYGGIFAKRGGGAAAVNGVSLSIEAGETVAVVGESGCGKSTLGLCALRLLRPTGGSVIFEGQDITGMSERRLRRLRRRMQIVFQDPYSSLNPKTRIGTVLTQAVGGQTRNGSRRIARDLLRQVGLPKGAMDCFPHEFSGGERQRIGIARALATEPDLIVADEPVSALDVSVQAQIVGLLQDLAEERQLAYLFISHDLGVVRQIADRVAVMYLGQIVELGDASDFFAAPVHPYSEALLSAVPSPNPNWRPNRVLLKGDPPSPTNIPSGCPFHTRCSYLTDVCESQMPALVEHRPKHLAACHHPRNVGLVPGSGGAGRRAIHRRAN